MGRISLDNEIVIITSVQKYKTLWLEATGMKHERVILYKEDNNAIAKAGYDISSWSTPEPKVLDQIAVVLIEKQSTRRVMAVRNLHNDDWVEVNRKHKL